MRTFIFGAGASIPFFSPRLDTSYLTKQVCCQSNWERVMEKYRHYKGQYANIVSVDRVLQIIDTIRSIVSEPNFEQIAEIIDKISSHGFDSNPRDNMLNLLIATLNTEFCPTNSHPFRADWKDVPFLFREIIAEAILDLQNNHKVACYQELINRQREFISVACNHDEEVSVMSLNYDDSIYDSLIGLGFEKGYRPTNPNYLMQLNIPEFMKAKRVVYFPHGHIKFQFVDNENVTYHPDSNSANQDRWKNIDGMTVGSTMNVTSGKFAYNFNTFLSTGQTKDAGFNNPPYSVYYQRLAIDLYNSNTVYIIGYSFGDEHFNRLLRSFIENDSNNKVFVIDFHDGPIDLAKSGEHPDAPNDLIHRIHHCLNTVWRLSYSESLILQPENPEEQDRINQTGFGQLFPQVYYYKNGYEAFLKEFQNIRELTS